MTRKAATYYTGAAGREKADRERERAAARAEARKNQSYMPFRFYVPVGETRQAIIVDEEPNFFRYEHALQNPRTKRWDTYTGCVMEFDNCPVCEATGKDSTYIMYLTVIDLTPFKTQDGKTVKYSRKLLAVKPAQQKKFQRMFEKAEAKGNSLRGALIEFTRDDDKSASIGNDIELVEYIDEDDLLTYTRSWKDKEGKRHDEDCFEPYDYPELFGDVDVDQLRALVGGEPTPGSRKHESSALGRRGRKTDDDDDDDDFESDKRTSRMKAKTKKRVEEDDDEEEDEEEETPKTRAKSAGRSRPSLGRRKAAVEEDDDDEEDEEEDDTPVSRTRAKTKAAPVKKPTTTRRGKRVEEDEEEDEDEDEDDAEATNKRNPRRVSMRRAR